MIGLGPMCLKCGHFHFDRLSVNACEAFPDGIPNEIFFEKTDHTIPYPGDHDIRFEPRN